MFGEIAPKAAGGRRAVAETQNNAKGTAQLGGTNSVVIGSGAVAVGPGSVVVGVTATANSSDNVAIGKTSTCSGSAAGAVAVGSSTSANNINAIAVGGSAVATSSGAVAVGGTSSASGSSSVVIGNAASASGSNGVSIGPSTSSAYAQGVSIGPVASTNFMGEICFSTGNFANASDSVHCSIVPFWMTTTDATPLELKTASSSGATVPAGVVILTNNSTYIWDVDIVARKSPTGTDYAMWNLKFCINRDANAASTALVGTPVKTLLGATAGASTWDVGVTADTTNGRPNISVTGQAGTTIRWVGHAKMTKCSG
jgi:hypothetical protein